VLREGVVSLFNTYEFVDPKLKDFADLANGRAIQQILNCMFSYDIFQDRTINPVRFNPMKKTTGL
jgi:hypothetical protein